MTDSDLRPEVRAGVEAFKQLKAYQEANAGSLSGEEEQEILALLKTFRSKFGIRDHFEPHAGGDFSTRKAAPLAERTAQDDRLMAEKGHYAVPARRESESGQPEIDPGYERRLNAPLCPKAAGYYDNE